MSEQSQSGRQSSSDIAYTQLKRKIIELEYEPKQHLVEEQLSTELDVSRTPLRQALYRLTLEGLLIKQPNGRMHVAPMTLSEVEEVYKVREVLEGLLAKEATINMTSEKLQELEDLLVLMKLSAEQNRNVHIVRYGSQFHQILYSLSTNHTAKRFMDQINFQIERYRRIGVNKNPSYSPENPIQEHEEILALIGKGLAEEVEVAMKNHISGRFEITKETVKKYLEK